MGKKAWQLINQSKWTRSATAGVIALAVAGVTGALVAPAGRHGPAALSEQGTAPAPSVTVTSLGPAAPITSVTTSAPSTLAEPWVPATPSPPVATPILTAKGSSDPVYYRLHITPP
ncbi:MAG TPA: hypothetical protein VFV02_02535, partial [Acidimicrobiales bacterium]|nr:hypothetical protein [Acidimicrobiales bacterium]